MNIETKFDLGQHVWCIRSSGVTRLAFCHVCKREGIVTIGDESFTCPKCNGRSKHEQYVGKRWYIAESSEIGKIDVELYSKQRDGNEDRITYMIAATGVVSGQVWDESDLFTSEADALAECVTRNAGKMFEDDK